MLSNWESQSLPPVPLSVPNGIVTLISDSGVLCKPRVTRIWLVNVPGLCPESVRNQTTGSEFLSGEPVFSLGIVVKVLLLVLVSASVGFEVLIHSLPFT